MQRRSRGQNLPHLLKHQRPDVCVCEVNGDGDVQVSDHVCDFLKQTTVCFLCTVVLKLSERGSRQGEGEGEEMGRK